MKVSAILPCLFTDSWQPKLTLFSIETMRMKTALDFEIVVVETGSKMLEDYAEEKGWIYLHKQEKTSYTKDFNAGIEAAAGDYIVHTAPDVIVGDRWLEAMIQCFDQKPDCGVSTVAVKEGGHVIGSDRPESSIVESFYGAIMMFPREMKLDESFPDQMSDYDLCMQVYEMGLRSYRNNISQAFHMKQEHNLTPAQNVKRFQYGLDRFNQKWKHRHWLIKDIILKGGVQYGQERP